MTTPQHGTWQEVLEAKAQYAILNTDCIAGMRAMPEASVDAIVTDPPYGLPGGFMGNSWDNFSGREDVAFGYYLAGLVDGEGHFGVHRNGVHGAHSCMFTIHLRRDDLAILKAAQRFVGHGTITEDTNGAAGTRTRMARWAVQDKEGCLAIVGFFRRFPLRAKKRLDFELWADAVEEWAERPRGNRWHGPAAQGEAAALKERLEGVRSYVEPPWSGHPFQDWTRLWAREAFRVLKPGGHIVAFGGSRTYHRLACAIEDAGFEVRDSVLWLHAQGFPKNHDVSAAIDEAAGAEREVVGTRVYAGGHVQNSSADKLAPPIGTFERAQDDRLITVPATSDAARWAGWGTALKPGHEPAVLARKPLSEGTVAANMVAHGTGGLNIEATRLPLQSGEDLTIKGDGGKPLDAQGDGFRFKRVDREGQLGRWPPNVAISHADECEMRGMKRVKAIQGGATREPGAGGFDSGFDGLRGLGNGFIKANVGVGDADGLETVEDWACVPGCPAGQLDAQAGHSVSRHIAKPSLAVREDDDVFGGGRSGFHRAHRAHVFGARGYDDEGGASRFFFCSKVSAAERNAGCFEGSHNLHPTLKPMALMLWLATLVCPSVKQVPNGGVVLDPFAGSGSCGAAVVPEGFRYIGMELDAKWCDVALRRIRFWSDERVRRAEARARLAAAVLAVRCAVHGEPLVVDKGGVGRCARCGKDAAPRTAVVKSLLGFADGV